MRYLTVYADFVISFEVLMRYLTLCGLYDLLGDTHALHHSMWDI